MAKIVMAKIAEERKAWLASLKPGDHVLVDHGYGMWSVHRVLSTNKSTITTCKLAHDQFQGSTRFYAKSGGSRALTSVKIVQIATEEQRKSLDRELRSEAKFNLVKLIQASSADLDSLRSITRLVEEWSPA